MFPYEMIQLYNETDICIYKYIVENIEQIPYMSIRELAGEIHTSPAAILRFCAKNNYEGYTDLKNALKNERELLKQHAPKEDLRELSSFFQRVNSSAFERKLSFAVETVRNAELILFLGRGSSGTLAQYGARYFSNLGKFSVGLGDTLYPVNAFSGQSTAVIVLSESGETQEIIDMVRKFQQKRFCILSITNSSLSTLAKISDWNFSYHLEQHRIHGNYNATSQIPALFVIEALARRI